MKRQIEGSYHRYISRRSFLTTAARAAGLVLASDLPLFGGEEQKASDEERNKKETMKYRRLGRTGFMVSEIGFGTTGITEANASLILDAMERGVNFIDTARGYGNGASERGIGKVVFKQHRKNFFICTKFSGGVKQIASSVDASLRDLETDVIDILMTHAFSGAKKIAEQMDAIGDEFEALKKAGKVRFFGVSSHTNVAPSLLEVVKTGRIDVILAAYSILNHETFGDLFKACKERDVGIVIMKSANQPAWKKAVEGGTYGDKDLFAEFKKQVPFDEKKMNIYQACYRWVLDHENLACVIPPMSSKSMIEEDCNVPFLSFK